MGAPDWVDVFPIKHVDISACYVIIFQRVIYSVGEKMDRIPMDPPPFSRTVIHGSPVNAVDRFPIPFRHLRTACSAPRVGNMKATNIDGFGWFWIKYGELFYFLSEVWWILLFLGALWWIISTNYFINLGQLYWGRFPCTASRWYPSWVLWESGLLKHDFHAWKRVELQDCMHTNHQQIECSPPKKHH